MPSSRVFQAAGILALTAALVLTGCKSSRSSSDQNDAGPNIVGDGGPDTHGDGGPGDTDAGFKCYYDDDCGENERCLLSLDDAQGDATKVNTCVHAMPCQTDESTCLDDSSTQYDYSYCINNPRFCRCVASALASAEDSRMTGYCKRPRPACAPCTADEQCGSTPFFGTGSSHNPAKCVPTSPDLAQKYCLEKYDALKCDCGYNKTIDAEHYCSPREDSGEVACQGGGEFTCCTKDFVSTGTGGECPQAHPICDKMTGICKDSCHYDFVTRTTVGCPAGKVCNVDPNHLKENDLSFGAGRCSSPCTDDNDCSKYSTATITFGCRAEAGSDKRCRPVGCLDDLECPDTPETDTYNSYCERNTLACICDPSNPTGACYCRGVREDGTDWLSPQGKPYKDDCKTGYKCAKGGDNKNTCIQKNCVDEEGAAVACNFGEMCCGEDRNQNGNHNDDICNKDVDGTDLANYGQCYMPPLDVWCSACTQNEDCEDPKFPVKQSAPFDKNICFAGGTNRCLIACDLRSECPNQFGCRYLEDTCVKGDAGGCGGRPDKCSDNCQKQQDGSYICRCACTTPYSTTECDPDGSRGLRCANGGGYCVYGMFCMEKITDPQAGTYLCDDLLAGQSGGN